MATRKGKPCPRCGGTGKVTDHSIKGAQLKRERESKGVLLREVSAKMQRSISYISDLEHGRKNWNPSLEKSYREAIGEAGGK